MHLPNIEDSLAAWPPLARLVRNVSRRDFLKFTTIAGSGLTLGVVVPAIAKNGGLRLRASRTRRVGPERFEVKGLVELFDTLDGKRTVGDLVESHPDRNDQLRVGRMLCLLEACDLARAA